MTFGLMLFTVFAVAPLRGTYMVRYVVPTWYLRGTYVVPKW